LKFLIQKFHEGDFAFEIGFRWEVAINFSPSRLIKLQWSEFLKSKLNKKLSTSQLENPFYYCLQAPISKPEVEKIRGVNCDFVIPKLLEERFDFL